MTQPNDSAAFDADPQFRDTFIDLIATAKSLLHWGDTLLNTHTTTPDILDWLDVSRGARATVKRAESLLVILALAFCTACADSPTQPGAFTVTGPAHKLTPPAGEAGHSAQSGFAASSVSGVCRGSATFSSSALGTATVTNLNRDCTVTATLIVWRSAQGHPVEVSDHVNVAQSTIQIAPGQSQTLSVGITECGPFFERNVYYGALPSGRPTIGEVGNLPFDAVGSYWTANVCPAGPLPPTVDAPPTVTQALNGDCFRGVLFHLDPTTNQPIGRSESSAWVGFSIAPGFGNITLTLVGFYYENPPNEFDQGVYAQVSGTFDQGGPYSLAIPMIPHQGQIDVKCGLWDGSKLTQANRHLMDSTVLTWLYNPMDGYGWRH